MGHWYFYVPECCCVLLLCVVVCCWVFLCVVVCCCVLGAVCEQVLRGGGGGWLLGLFPHPPHHYSQVYMGARWGGGYSYIRSDPSLAVS